MPGSPEHPPRPEIPPPPFLLAARFPSREASQTPYDALQGIVRDQQVELSVFRLIHNWPESMSKAPPSNNKWYVAILGESPPEPIQKRVVEAMSMGEQVALPDLVVAEMARRRLLETAKGPYIEHHRDLNIPRREDLRREKQKRKQQKNSRRRNRGK